MIGTAVGFAGGPEDDPFRIDREAFLRLEAYARRIALQQSEPPRRPDPLALDDDYRRHLGALDAEILRLLENVERLNAEEIEILAEALVNRRRILADQLELEILVKRPARKGELPRDADDELIEGYRKALDLTEKILATLHARLASGTAAPPADTVQNQDSGLACDGEEAGGDAEPSNDPK